jgi:hypothetical protein
MISSHLFELVEVLILLLVHAPVRRLGMKLSILVILVGTMGVAHAGPKRTVVADTERGGMREISYVEPEIEAEDLDDSSVTESDEAQNELDFAQWLYELSAQKPDLFTEDIGETKAVIDVDKSTQTGKIIIGGKVVEKFKVSTGRAGHATPSGTFKPGARKANWLSRYATREYGRKIYLKHAVQISGGNFMHAASAPAMNWLGKRRSAGCVRVPPRIAAKVYGIVNSMTAVFKVH